ncbi:MAG TPA: type II toxin-antitoxin system VapC family toxin [bacterium]|nr:type II toxin-antitoxin system VapC family toxin [bacterium]
MIVLDTHIWIRWVDNPEKLRKKHQQIIKDNEDKGLVISRISCWEVAKLVENGKLTLNLPVKKWLEGATSYPGIKLIELTNSIIIDSTQLPGKFHKDPADQLIVATARILDTPLLTNDGKILKYKYVKHYK